MASHYANYIKERLGRGILENEFGFATFEYPTSTIVYIIDVYVVPEARRSRKAWALVDEIVEQAKKDGKKYAMTSVDAATKSAEDSIKAIKAYGFSEHHVDGSMIFYAKEI